VGRALNLPLPKPVLFHLDEHVPINPGVVPSYRRLSGRLGLWELPG